MSTGAPRGAPRRLPLLSRRRGASFFSSVSPRGCPRALPFSAVVPLPILTAFVFPFFPPFFLSAFVPAFPLSRFPAFPLSRFPASNPFRFCRQKQRGGAVFSAPPRGNDVILLFRCSPLCPPRKIAVGRVEGVGLTTFTARRDRPLIPRALRRGCRSRRRKTQAPPQAAPHQRHARHSRVL